MKQKKIEIKGISRMLPQSLSDDGLTRDLLNLRNYNGALRPVGNDTVFQTAGVVEDKEHYIHRTTDGNEWIITSNENGIVVYTKVGGQNTVQIYGEANKTYRYSSLGNLLIIFNETDEKMLYALYDIDSESYQHWIGEERFPEVLDIRFTTELTFIEELYFDATGNEDEDLASITGNFAKLEGKANAEGKFSGDVLFMYAFEMFDGSIIKHSQPIFVRGGIWYWKAPVNVIWTKLAASTLRAWVNTSDVDLTALREKYGSLIKSVNIYMTRPFNRYILTNIDNCTANSTYVEVDRKTNTEVYDSVISIPSFRLVKKLTLDELVHDGLHLLTPMAVSEIETLQPLPIDNFTHHKLYSKNDFIYNSRIWLGDVKTRLYKGYNPELFVGYSSPVYNNASYNIIFAVTLKDIDGERLVYSDPFPYTYTDSGINPKFTIETFFSYPDSRATKLQIIVQIGANYYLAGEYNLISHSTLNFSYAIFDSITIDGSTFGAPLPPLDAVSDIILDRNRIQASYVSNALYFPAENSYNVGSGIIMGMGANTLNIESGQFGDYPLYVFTTDGGWAMSISRNQSILIDSIKPAFMDVCTNSKAILPTPYGVIFITAKGVMLVSGMNAVRLDIVFEGDYQSPLKNSIDYTEVLEDDSIANTSAFLETVAYATFLQTARMAYNNIKEEIIVANTAYPYSYAYSFQTKSWFRIGKSYESFCNYYPKMLGVRTVATVAKLYDITVEDWSTELYIPVLIETYPIKLEIDILKKISTLACRGRFNTENESGCGLYLFGSVEGIMWLNMLALENTGTFMNLITGRAPYSAYQFIIVFSGTIDQNSYLTHFEIVYSEKFIGKLR